MIKVIQINVGGFDNNFSYLILGEGVHSKEAVLIDATGSAEAIEGALKANNAQFVLQIFTHLHPDHCELLEYFEKKGIKTFKPSEAKLGTEEELTAAGMKLKLVHTPGHTAESVCIIVENNIFAGDILFVRGIGTTAYGGNDAELNSSLRFLASLNGELTLWPGHDYGGASSSLKIALKNSHIKPGKTAHEKIKKKVEEYESKASRKKF